LFKSLQLEFEARRSWKSQLPEVWDQKNSNIRQQRKYFCKSAQRRPCNSKDREKENMLYNVKLAKENIFLHPIKD